MLHLRDKEYFSLIDLKDGFFHVNLKESDGEKTTFYTGERLMQFVKTPQGYKKSPAVFQGVMNLIFKDVIIKKCDIDIDDILVYGRDLQEHDENFKEILNILSK